MSTVALRQACFSDNQYEHNAFQKCFSNLLGIGFKRFAVDVYWNPLRTEWSLCPVEQPGSDTDNEQDSVVSGSTVVVSAATASAKIPESTPLQPGGFALGRRQAMSETSSAVSTTAISSSSSLSSGQSTSEAVKPTITSFPTTSGPPLMQIGSYNCTSLMTLGLLTGLLADFMDATDTTTGASLTLLILNLHAASSLSDPDGPALLLSQDQLPQSGTLLSDILKGNLSEDTYTPSRLQDQRANLNSSWYDVDWNNRPAEGYYEASPDANGRLATIDGWPSEAFMEFQEFYRIVASFGTVDPQMQYYNIGSDFDYVFPPGTLTKVVETSIESDGQVSSGCLFAPSENTLTSGTNSSWAMSVPSSLEVGANPDLMSPILSIANLTSCGLSPFLNQSLANTTADKNPLPYAAYVHSSLWSWAPGEPLNVTSDATKNRCVAMTISPYPGRWSVTDCADRYRVACQDPSQPYNWQISSDSTDYEGAASACPSSYQFSVPHTALENAHLLAALQAHRQSVPTDDAILVDLNQLSVADCWVVGINGTCPYLSRTDTDQTRIVVVPTVAAVIIFVLAALTFFVKCAANRREDKRGRKRRMVGGWEYEGVPS
ncbi:Maintenance of telomere capping protein 6 [Neocucurbitaria cava]|uniref:Maintenance of telomere capping protein 6 n=1 Tax=Neocucurbitaria cava TaxID=798079 RepID=A0A9W8Y1B6_9PLEO|nr:Maintenance of telomere capping protein 6 [Neocucurbitaria cava]